MEEKTRGLREVSLLRWPPWDSIRVAVKIMKNGKESKMNIKIQKEVEGRTRGKK